MATQPYGISGHHDLSTEDRDKLSPVWDMSQERAFTENLLCQRFNFFLIFFSLTIAGFVNTHNKLYAELILIIGTTILWMLALTLQRSQQKLDIILNQDIFPDPNHPASIINNAAGSSGSKRRIIGIGIPRLCVGILFTASIAHLTYMICTCCKCF
jgi:hypothetical protein